MYQVLCLLSASNDELDVVFLSLLEWTLGSSSSRNSTWTLYRGSRIELGGLGVVTSPLVWMVNSGECSCALLLKTALR